MATGSRWGVGAGVGLGAEISCGAAFTSGVGFGGVRFAGPPCGVGVVLFPASSPESVLRRGEESQKLAVESAWVWRFLAALLLPQGSVLAALGSLARHAGSAWVSFPASSPESALRRGEESQKQAVYSVRLAAVSVLVSPASLVFHLTASENPQALPEGFAPSRFGGTDLFPAAVAPGEAPGALGDPPGTFLFGDCFSSGEPGVVGFSPGPVGEPPGVPEGFAPSRFGGTDLFPAAAALGEAPRSNIRVRRTRARFH